MDRDRSGSKHHVIVGRHGTPPAVALTGGNRRDVTRLRPLLDAIPRIRGATGRPRHRPRRLFADRGYDYDYDKYRRLLWKRGITPVIARRGVPRLRPGRRLLGGRAPGPHPPLTHGPTTHVPVYPYTGAGTSCAAMPIPVPLLR